MEALEHFRFIYWHLDWVEGGFFLRKKPLGCMASANTRSENAIAEQLDFAPQQLPSGDFRIGDETLGAMRVDAFPTA
jgi:hypothetical protein